MKLNAQRSDFTFKHVKKEEMLDNVELMKELKKMREKKRKYEIELRKLEQEVTKQKQKVNRMEGEKKRVEQQEAKEKRNETKMSLRDSYKDLDTQPTSNVKTLRASASVGSLNSVGGGLGSFRKIPGKLAKGSSLKRLQEGSLEDQQRIKELKNLLEDNYTLELLHQLEIRSLKDKIIQLHKGIENMPGTLYGVHPTHLP